MEVVEVALTPKEIMGDGLKMLNFQESKGLYVLFFNVHNFSCFDHNYWDDSTDEVSVLDLDM